MSLLRLLSDHDRAVDALFAAPGGKPPWSMVETYHAAADAINQCVRISLEEETNDGLDRLVGALCAKANCERSGLAGLLCSGMQLVGLHPPLIEREITLALELVKEISLDDGFEPRLRVMKLSIDDPPLARRVLLAILWLVRGFTTGHLGIVVSEELVAS